MEPCAIHLAWSRVDRAEVVTSRSQIAGSSSITPPGTHGDRAVPKSSRGVHNSTGGVTLQVGRRQRSTYPQRWLAGWLCDFNYLLY